MTYFTVTAVQMPVCSGSENSALMKKNLAALMHTFPATNMVLFSELCAYGPDKAFAEVEGGATEMMFCAMAREHHIWLLPGSIYVKDAGKIYNSCPVISPEGKIIARYRKIFPFTPFETGIEPGSDFCVFDIPEVGRFGVSICYDKWFPETTRTMAVMGAEVILHPTMTDTIDRDIEISIARASAAMNQCYFFDINGTGECGVGRSVIIGPAGDVIHQAGSAQEIMPIEINLGRVRHERDKGIMSLGQPLKSFRDNRVDFQKAQTSPAIDAYLGGLGPVQKNRRG